MAIAPAIGELGFRRPLLATAAAAGTVLALDHGSKAWFRANVEEHDWGPTIGPVRTKRVEHHEGVPNGVNSGKVEHMAIAAGAVGAGSIGGAAMMAYLPQSWSRVTLPAAAIGGIMLGSMLGNAGEMAARGSVTDFIYVDLPDEMDSSYLVANVADVGIATGYLGMGALALGGAGYGVLRGVRALARAV